MSQQQPAKTGAEEIHWNLADLYPDSMALERDLQGAEAAAQEFAKQYRGRVASLNDSGLAAALKKFEALQERLSRAHTYVYLNWCTNMEDSKRGALLQKVREISTQIQHKILFFELDWIQLEAKPAEKLLKSTPLAPYRHYLERERLTKPHVLGEPEEKILSEKALTGRHAWNRFFDEIFGSARFSFDHQELNQQEILAKLYSADRKVRKRAAHSFTEGLDHHLRELTYIFNTVLADKSSDDQLRNYPNWLSSRNLSNEISTEAVQTLIESVTDRYDLVARYYNLKGKLLGLEELHDYDRYAPLEKVDTLYSWNQAKVITVQAYESFHPRLGSIAAEFFEQRWIDAPIEAGKIGGAFSHQAVPSAHPYVLVNYTGTIRDVETLAHELGHGVHQYLSRKQGLLQSDTPLTLAETASTFGEMLAFDSLMEQEDRPSARLAMLVSKIDDIVATVFRQVAMNRFEDRIHTTRRTKGELSSEHFSELWMETQKEMFQGSVQLGDHYGIWWSYIPHFLHTPGYVYAYAFGELLVLALYSQYQKEGDAFVKRYLSLLEAGGSDWPHVLLGKLGVDLNDSQFWQEGLSAIEKMITRAEGMEEEAGGKADS
ncbi:MAG: M3 family oligoendopeptidase [Acidobacteria bacterium]|nr:M3 family oligoendopeptidase [Acidobacteriota bacterium]